MLVRLKVMHGPSAGKEIKIVQTPFVIGRQDDCQLRPKSDAISRRHCELVIADSQLIARDLGSKNGTYVNGDRIVGDRVLRFGDHLKVGPLEFEVAIEVGITGEKRPKVTGVKDVALRSGDGKAHHRERCFGGSRSSVGEWQSRCNAQRPRAPGLADAIRHLVVGQA